MFNQMTTHDWLELSAEDKDLLIQQFGLKRSGSGHVFNNQGKFEVQSDGYTTKDIAGINIQTLQEFTGSISESFSELFQLALVKLNPNRYGTPTETEQVTEIGTGEIDRPEGSDAGESEEPVMATPPVVRDDGAGSGDGTPSNHHGTPTSLQQSDDGADSIGHEVARKGRSKKSPVS